MTTAPLPEIQEYRIERKPVNFRSRRKTGSLRLRFALRSPLHPQTARYRAVPRIPVQDAPASLHLPDQDVHFTRTPPRELRVETLGLPDQTGCGPGIFHCDGELQVSISHLQRVQFQPDFI